jgi:hypothetical protein
MLQLEPIAAAPVLGLTPQDLDTIIDELRAYHASRPARCAVAGWPAMKGLVVIQRCSITLTA